MIKLIVCDMDGTLLNSKKEMPKGMFTCIRELSKEGIYFCAASGRQYYSLAESFAPVKDDMFFIADNGCMVVKGKNDEQIDSHIIPIDFVHQFVKISQQLPHTHVVLSGLKYAYYVDSEEEILKNIYPYYHRRKQVDDLLDVDDDIFKIAILNLNGTADHVYPFYQQFSKEFSVAVSAFEWMDIMPKNIHKGNALISLQEKLNISKSETMAFGDFMNDYEMLKEADYSFAMKNALPQIKQICRFETAFTNEEEGVLKEIERCRQNNWEFIKKQGD